MDCFNCGCRMHTIKLKQCYDNTTTIQIKANCKNCGQQFITDEFEDEKDFDDEEPSDFNDIQTKMVLVEERKRDI